MKFLISAGHGGSDPGNTASGRKEADIAVELRNIIASKLRASGHDVATDGNLRDNFTLVDAIKQIVSGRTCIEIHTNAGPPTAQGVEVIAETKHAKLAKNIAKGIADVLGTSLRRDKGFFDYAQLVREQGRTLGFVKKGGIIVETFFQSNAKELAAYDAKKWLVASAIVKALEG
jgi:N-acetylmuramoyl-L-alanine amidase